MAKSKGARQSKSSKKHSKKHSRKHSRNNPKRRKHKGGGYGYVNSNNLISTGVKGTYIPIESVNNPGINSDTSFGAGSQYGGGYYYGYNPSLLNKYGGVMSASNQMENNCIGGKKNKTRKRKRNNKSKKNKKRKNNKKSRKSKRVRKMRGGNLMNPSPFSNTYTLNPNLEHNALANPMNHKTFVNCADNYNHYNGAKV